MSELQMDNAAHTGMSDRIRWPERLRQTVRQKRFLGSLAVVLVATAACTSMEDSSGEAPDPTRPPAVESTIQTPRAEAALPGSLQATMEGLGFTASDPISEGINTLVFSQESVVFAPDLNTAPTNALLVSDDGATINAAFVRFHIAGSEAHNKHPLAGSTIGCDMPVGWTPEEVVNSVEGITRSAGSHFMSSKDMSTVVTYTYSDNTEVEINCFLS